MPKGEGLMGRGEIFNCPWRLHQGQRETKRERETRRKVGREKKKEEERRDAQTQRKMLWLLSSLSQTFSCLPFS